MESVTLPTRIRPSGGQQGSLALLETALNTTGRQTVFDLHSSVDILQKYQTNGHTDSLVPVQPERLVQEDTEPEVSASTFDIEYIGEAIPGDHKFGQIEVYRHCVQSGIWTGGSDTVAPRQMQEETFVTKFDARAPFPLLDTFPDTLFRVDHAPSLNIYACRNDHDFRNEAPNP